MKKAWPLCRHMEAEKLTSMNKTGICRNIPQYRVDTTTMLSVCFPVSVTSEYDLKGWRVICAHKSGSSVHTDPVHLNTHFGFICTHISGSSVHTELSRDGVGLGRPITFIFLRAPRHSKPYHFSSLQQTQAPIWGWGRVGRGDNVHVPVHTEAQQPYHLSCCPADTGAIFG